MRPPAPTEYPMRRLTNLVVGLTALAGCVGCTIAAMTAASTPQAWAALVTATAVCGAPAGWCLAAAATGEPE
jgi:hypothetical protein